MMLFQLVATAGEDSIYNTLHWCTAPNFLRDFSRWSRNCSQACIDADGPMMRELSNEWVESMYSDSDKGKCGYVQGYAQGTACTLPVDVN